MNNPFISEASKRPVYRGPRVIPMTADAPHVKPLTADDSHVVPMTADAPHVKPLTADDSHVVPMTADDHASLRDETDAEMLRRLQRERAEAAQRRADLEAEIRRLDREIAAMREPTSWQSSGKTEAYL